MNRHSSLPLIPKTSNSSRRTHRKFLAINPEDPHTLSSVFNRQVQSTRHTNEAQTRFDFLMSREGNRNSTVPEYKGQVGLDARMEFYETYKEISKFTQMNRFLATDENPNIAYLQEIRSKKLAPAPFGVVKRKGEPDAIDVKKMGMGDSYAIALSQSLKHLNTVKKLNLHSNRLTERGSSRILTTLKVGSLVELNLSENQIGSGSVERIIDILSDRKCELKRLILEKTNMSSTDIVRICEELEMNNTVSKLNLAKNAISGPAVNALASLVSGNTTIKYLDLHWNNIRGQGSVNLFKALASNKTIKVLDISWNSMGNNETTELAYAISDAVSSNKRLSHVDLSYNYFNKKESDIIAKGLKNNHTIYGLHMLGNDCALDSRGFIIPRTISDGHFTNQPMEFRRIIDEPAYSNRSFNSNCWLCDKWVEYTFYWRSGASGPAESEPVFIHLDVDNYHPEMMKKGHHGVFSLTRAVPQREVRFFYSHIEGKNIIPMLNKLIKVRKLDDKMTARVKFWEGKIEDMNVMSVNSVMPKGQVCDMKQPFHTVPRLPVNSYTPPEKEPERIIWSIPISLFKDYKLDSEVLTIQTHLNKCFEFDWNEGKIPNFVKNPEDLLAVKEMLRSNYKHIREAYKHLSALSGIEVFGISPNGILDFLSSCKVMDQYYTSSDMGVNWNAVSISKNKGQLYNAANALCRYEFLEVIVRIAYDRYIRNGLCKSVSESLSRMLNEHLLPRLTTFNSDRWRIETYMNEQVDLTLKAHKPILDSIYKRYSGRKTLPGYKPFMCLEEFRDLCNDSRLVNENLVARDTDLVFSLAMMTRVDEVYKKDHLEMTYVEFLEALCRAIDKASIPTPPEELDEEEQKLYPEDPKSLMLDVKIRNAMKLLIKVCPVLLQGVFVFPTQETIEKMKYKQPTEEAWNEIETLDPSLEGFKRVMLKKRTIKK